MRTILHCDLNNFFASVECTLDANLKNKYVAVAGDISERHGIILAKNTLAKSMGVKTGEAIWQARNKCPQLVCVLPHYEAYLDYGKAVREIYARYTNLVESFGLDECWLDVTDSVGVFGTGREIADKLRLEVKQETGLTISVGVSYNKIFAKLGSDMKKPDATTEINESNFKEKVWRLNANEMIMVGEKTYAQLKKMNIITLGDLANSNENLLLSTFGINGIKLKRYASGLDDSPVVANANLPPIKSVGHGTTTKQDITDYLQADKVIYYLSEMVATRLRRYGMEAQVIHIDIRYSNLSHKTIQCRVEHNFIAKTIAETACTLLRSAWKPDIDTPLRTITVSTADLTPVASNFQTSLFDNNNSEKMQKIEFTLDQIRKKFGFNSISRACLAGDDLLADKLATKEDLLPFKK